MKLLKYFPLIIILALIGCEFGFVGDIYIRDLDELQAGNKAKSLSTTGQFRFEVPAAKKEYETKIMKLLDGVFPNAKFAGFQDLGLDTFGKVNVKIPVVSKMNSGDAKNSLFSVIVDPKKKSVLLFQNQRMLGLVKSRLKDNFESLDFDESKISLKFVNDTREARVIKLKESSFVNGKRSTGGLP